LEEPGAVLLEQGLGEGLWRLGPEPGKELGEAGGIGSAGVKRGRLAYRIRLEIELWLASAQS
jgi:hypothetical protein